MKRQKHIRKRISILLATLMISLVGTACGKKDTAESAQEEFKYGSIQISALDGALCGAPIYVAYEKGYFAEEGYDVELIAADFETRKIGLNNGTMPIVNGDFQFFPSIEQGIDVSVVDGFHTGCIKLVVSADSDINSAEDLRGKRIGVDEIGGTPHQVASVWIENAGISALQEDGEVTFLPYSDGNLELQALYNGDIDVAAIWDPLGSVAEKEGKARVIFDLSTDPAFAGKNCCFIFASNKVLEEDPERVAALLRALHKAEDFINENPEETIDIIEEGQYAEITDRDLAIELIKSYNFPSEADRLAGLNNAKADVEYFSGALNSIGYLKTDSATFTENNYFEVDLGN